MCSTCLRVSGAQHYYCYKMHTKTRFLIPKRKCIFQKKKKMRARLCNRRTMNQTRLLCMCVCVCVCVFASACKSNACSVQENAGQIAELSEFKTTTGHSRQVIGKQERERERLRTRSERKETKKKEQERKRRPSGQLCLWSVQFNSNWKSESARTGNAFFININATKTHTHTHREKEPRHLHCKENDMNSGGAADFRRFPFASDAFLICYFVYNFIH